MSEIVIYHNSRCSKSNEGVRFVEEMGFLPIIKYYLNDPLTDEELKTMLKGYVGDLKELVRVKDAKKLDVNLPTDYTFDEVFNLLKAAPAILERPVVGNKGKFIVARPAEKAKVVL